MSPQLQLVHDIASFTHDPLGHALYCYPWGTGSIAEAQGPRKWQRGALKAIGMHLSNPATRFEPCRVAIASGHGVGKSALVGMIVKWAIDTCEDTRVVVTANTESQIIGKTWPEITKWHNLSITKGWFTPTATALRSIVAGHEKAWQAEAVTWSVNNTEAFAGLHNKGKRIVIIFDEASGIDDKVWEVTQGALTDEQTEIIWVAFGNPTKNTGRFRECFGREKRLWYTKQLDSRSVDGTNKAYLAELVATYGENSDLVKVRVKGQFPSASAMQFIGSDVAEAAVKRVPTHIPSDPIVFGLDHARFGDDDSVLCIRRGRDAQSFPWKVWRGANSMQIAGDVMLLAETFKPDAIFIDAGGPNAGGVIDRLRQLGCRGVHEINFGGEGREANWGGTVRVRTFNKRAEMWTNMRAWMEGGSIPNDPIMLTNDFGIEYDYGADQSTIVLERKKDMKKRGLSSPDRGDALALTFAEHVAPRDPLGGGSVLGYRPPAVDRYAELSGGR